MATGTKAKKAIAEQLRLEAKELGRSADAIEFAVARGDTEWLVNPAEIAALYREAERLAAGWLEALPKPPGRPRMKAEAATAFAKALQSSGMFRVPKRRGGPEKVQTEAWALDIIAQTRVLREALERDRGSPFPSEISALRAICESHARRQGKSIRGAGKEALSIQKQLDVARRITDTPPIRRNRRAAK